MFLLPGAPLPTDDRVLEELQEQASQKHDMLARVVKQNEKIQENLRTTNERLDQHAQEAKDLIEQMKAVGDEVGPCRILIVNLSVVQTTLILLHAFS